MMNLIKEYGLDEMEVRQWGAKHYPQFTNLNILAQLYLKQVKKVEIDPRMLSVTGKKVSVADLKAGEWCVVEVQVGVKTRQNAYRGCPKCWKSVREGGVCPDCGVETVVMTWDDYVAGDNTGEIIVSLPPRLTMKGVDLEGTTIRARGVLRDSGEFMINAYQIVQANPPAGSEVPASPKVPLPSTTASESSATSPPGGLNREREDVKKILDIFGEVPWDELAKWHEFRKFTTPLTELLQGIAEVKDGRVRRLSSG